MNWLTQLFQRPQTPQAGNMLAQAAQVPAMQGQPQAGMPQPVAPQQPGIMQRLQNFGNSERGQILGDTFAGWAMGGTPGESLGYGALMARQGRGDRQTQQQQQQQANQTQEWLRSQGLDDQTVGILSSNPELLQQYMADTMLPKQPETTDDIREYNFAVQQGYGGNFNDFMTEQRRAGATTVNNNIPGAPTIGTIPQGFAAQQDPNTGEWSMQPIAGGPAAIEAQQAAQIEQNRQQGVQQRGGLLAEEIDRALVTMDTGILPDTGVGAVLSNIPGTDARDLSATLDTVRANIGFEELNRMRQQSPTGGALGNVTERELQFLQSVAGSLDQAQSPDQLRYNLNRLWNTYMDTIHGEGKGPARRPLTWRPSQSAGPDDMSTMSDEELEAILNGQ